MVGHTHPALDAFLVQLDDEFIFAEVRLRQRAEGFELRHVADTEIAETDLALVQVTDLRALAQTTTGGAFRPNKAAPNLRRGWRSIARNSGELETALRHLYPGALADWFAAHSPSPAITDYRELAARQTGLYRITQILPDALVAQTTQACCAPEFCLRRRLWTTPDLGPDSSAGKSVIPCLEPCSLMLDLARRAMKLEQEPKADFAPTEGDVPVLIHALECALARPDPDVREGNSADAKNPRRMRLLLEKLRPLLPAKSASMD